MQVCACVYDKSGTDLSDLAFQRLDRVLFV